jgi:hypothetical protein
MLEMFLFDLGKSTCIIHILCRKILEKKIPAIKYERKRPVVSICDSVSGFAITHFR